MSSLSRGFGIFVAVVVLFAVQPPELAFGQRGGRGPTSSEPQSETRPSPSSEEARPARAPSNEEPERSPEPERPAPTPRHTEPQDDNRSGRGGSTPEPARPSRDDSREERTGRADDANRNSDRAGRGRTAESGDARTGTRRPPRSESPRQPDPGRGATGGGDRDGRTGGNDRPRVDDRERDTDRQGRRTDRRSPAPDYRPPQGGGGWYEPPPPRYRPRPNYHPHGAVRIDVRWPWEYRYRRGWAPHYQYRQVVYLDVGWGHYRRETRLDVRTRYSQRLRRAAPYRAEVDIYLEAIEIFEDGHFLGEVTRFPSGFDRIRGTIYRNGHVELDRQLFLVGDPRVGFELVSTRWYDDYLLNAYHPAHGFRAGVLDFRRHRVVPVRRSRLFDPYDFGGYAPIALLPEDHELLFDYGYHAPSIYYHDWDGYHYYGGGFDDRYYLDDSDRHEIYARSGEPRGSTAPPVASDRRERGRSATAGDDHAPLRRYDEDAIRTERGADIQIRREAEVQRIE